jgi:hypothetical protein
VVIVLQSEVQVQTSEIQEDNTDGGPNFKGEDGVIARTTSTHPSMRLLEETRRRRKEKAACSLDNKRAKNAIQQTTTVRSISKNDGPGNSIDANYGIRKTWRVSELSVRNADLRSSKEGSKC